MQHEIREGRKVTVRNSRVAEIYSTKLTHGADKRGPPPGARGGGKLQYEAHEERKVTARNSRTGTKVTARNSRAGNLGPDPRRGQRRANRCCAQGSALDARCVARKSRARCLTASLPPAFSPRRELGAVAASQLGGAQRPSFVRAKASPPPTPVRRQARRRARVGAGRPMETQCQQDPANPVCCRLAGVGCRSALARASRRLAGRRAARWEASGRAGARLGPAGRAATLRGAKALCSYIIASWSGTLRYPSQRCSSNAGPKERPALCAGAARRVSNGCGDSVCRDLHLLLLRCLMPLA